MEQLKLFTQQSSLRYCLYSPKLNSKDSEFLELLLTRPSIPRSARNKTIRKTKTKLNIFFCYLNLLESDIPLTDAVLDLIHTCLHSRDTIISYQTNHQILRTVFGHLIEEFVSVLSFTIKNKIYF